MGDLRTLLRVQQRFLLLVILCLACTALAGVFFARSLLKPDTGLVGYYPEVEVQGDTVLYSPSAPFSPAMASGLLPGRDAIISVNGIPVAGSRDLVRALSRITRFAPVPVTVRRDGAAVMTIRVDPVFIPTRVEWAFVLVFCLALATAAFTLSWRLPQEPGTPALVLSALLTLVFTCLKPFAYESIAANLLFNLGNIGSWLLVVFAMHFPRERGTRGFRAGVVCLLVGLYAAFSALRVSLYARWMASGLESMLAGYKLVGQIGNISDGTAYVVLAVLLVTAYRKTAVSRDRTMLQWLIAGMLLSLPPYFFFDQLPLIIGGNAVRVGLGSIAQLFLSILPVFLLIGLTRYRAFDFGFFMTRYALYGTLFLLMIALFAVLYLPLRAALERGYTVGSPLPELFAAGTILILLALLRIPLERLFSQWTRRVPHGFAGADAAGPMPFTPKRLRADGQSPQARRLAEARAIMRGFVGALREPVRRLTTQIPLDRQQGEAAARVTDLLSTLGSLAGSGSTLSSSSTADSVVRRAVQRARDRFAAVEFQVTGGCSALLTCRTEELAQAVSFILENAAEAQDRSTNPIVIGVWSDSERVYMDITDRGPGIDARARRRLFSPFFTTKPGHHGMGLYFARLIVESNEGTMEIGPSETGGTRVLLAFPREAAGGAREAP
jgi:signal transduction histidine kinase